MGIAGVSWLSRYMVMVTVSVGVSFSVCKPGLE